VQNDTTTVIYRCSNGKLSDVSSLGFNSAFNTI